MPPNPGLVDQFGNAVSSAAFRDMRSETAPVGGQYSRPPFAPSLVFSADPQRLARIIQAGDNGNTLDWAILAEEVEESFTHYAAVLGKRKRQVSQLPITVDAASGEESEAEAFEEHAELVRDWLKTGVLQTALFDVLDGIGKGWSAHEVVWDQVPGRVWPSGLIYRPQRFFEFSYTDATTLLLRSEEGLKTLPPHKFLVHLHPAKSGNIGRSGITRMIAFMWCYATYTLRDWAMFVQAYGLPIRVGKYGPGASDADKRTLWQAVRSIAGDVAAIIPNSMDLEFVEASERGIGAAVYEQRMDWIQRECSKLVLGGTAGTEALRGGHAVGQEHREAEQDVERFDAFLLNNSINRQIVQTMVALTFGPQRAYPTLHIGRQDDVPLADFTAALQAFIPLGLKVRADQVRERLSIDKPDEGDEILGAPPPPEPPEPPETPPPALTARILSAGWTALRADVPEEIADALRERLAQDAAGALAGLAEPIQRAFTDATDMRDLARRVAALDLPPKDFAEAMARGLALAHLVGQAEMVQETRGRL